MAHYIETAQIADSVLKAAVKTGMQGRLMAAPSAIQIGDKVLKYLDKRSRARAARTLLGYMSSQSLVTYRPLPNGDYEITITEKGKKRLRKSQFDQLALPKPQACDARWWLVLFDVPETRHKSRRAFSYKLRLMGFYQLQKSVWVIPYPCTKAVELIGQVFEAPAIARGSALKRYFHPAGAIR